MGGNMRKKVILFAILAFILFLVIGSFISNYTYKHAYTTKSITSFTIPELKNCDVWTTDIAASDSMIYIIKCWDDTTSVIGYTSKSYAYSFRGMKDIAFNLPKDSYSQSVFSDFGYLYHKKQLYLCNLNQNAVNFFDLQGKLVRRVIVGKVKSTAKYSIWHPFADFNKVNSVAEFKDDLYYTITQNSKTWGLFKEQPGKRMKLIQSVKQTKKEKLNDLYVFMVDSNDKNTMAVAEVMRKEILVSFFSNDKERKFSISRHPDSEIPWYFYLWDWPKMANIWKSMFTSLPPWTPSPVMPWAFYTGSNYIVLKIWGRADDKAPDTCILYNLHGRRLGELICTTDKDANLVDISGDKLIFLNRNTGRVSIEQIKVK
jgi:hypothetical protein